MDQEGLFLMIKSCGLCSSNGKENAKKCLLKKHNPCMTTVRADEVTSAHRLCVKPDQPRTVYKLRDTEKNEEFLEFDENIVFQIPCDKCSNIKTCSEARHRLVDWRPSRLAKDGTAEAQAPIEPEHPMKGNEAAGKKSKLKKKKGCKERAAQKPSSNKRKLTGPLTRGNGSPPAKTNRVLSPRSSESRLKKCQETPDTGSSAAKDDMAIEDDNGEPCTAGNTEEGGPSRLLDPPVETAVASPPKTIAERLETVKAEEADLLRKFEKTHERYAKEEARKRAEMEEFQRAGEEALRVMRVAREEKLREILEKGTTLKTERRELVQQRLKEIEAEEKAARAEALARDARLEAERKRLAHSYESMGQMAPVGGDGSAVDGYARLSFSVEETGKGPMASVASPRDIEALQTTSSDGTAESLFPKAAAEGGATNHVNGVPSERCCSTVFSTLKSCNGGQAGMIET